MADNLGTQIVNTWTDWVTKTIQSGNTPTADMLHAMLCDFHDQKMARQVLEVMRRNPGCVDPAPVPSQETLAYAVDNLSEGWVQLLIDAGARPTPEMLHSVVESRRSDIAGILIGNSDIIPLRKTVRLAKKQNRGELAKAFNEMRKAAAAEARAKSPRRGLFRFFRKAAP